MHSAKIFQNGQSQAVRLPKEFRFHEDSVAIRRIGNAVILQPHKKGWDTLLGSLDQFSPDFMEDSTGCDREQPPVQIRESF